MDPSKWEDLCKTLPRNWRSDLQVGAELLRLDIGTAIRALRKRQGVTLLNLTARTRLSLNKVTIMENELTNFELGTLLRVAHALGSSLEVRFVPLDECEQEESNRASDHDRKLADAPLKKVGKRVVEGTVEASQLSAVVSEGLAQLGLSEVFTAMRKEAKLRQKQLAARAGFSPSKICNVEDGPRNLMLATIIRIARALGRRVQIRFLPTTPSDSSKTNHK